MGARSTSGLGFVLVFFCSTLCSWGQPSVSINTADKIRDTVKVGIFINSIYDLDYQRGSFSVNYTVWRLNKKREFKDYYLFLPMNALELDTLVSSAEFHDQSENIISRRTGDTTFWDYYDMTGKFRHEFDVRTYPFEVEELVMEFEGNMYYDHYVELAIDNQSGTDTLKLDSWEISPIKTLTTEKTYPTNFGSPGESGTHTYARFKVVIPIKRSGGSLFVKLFIGVLVAFFIAFFSLRINIAEADGRFGVCVGAIFAALANMYIVTLNVPLASKFTFMDALHILVILVIFWIFLCSTRSLKYYKEDKYKRVQKIDRRATTSSFLIFSLGLIGIYLYFFGSKVF